MKHVLFLCGLLMLISHISIAQNNWELRKNENGIAVYTRNASSGNLKELRVICELEGTRAQLISALRDIENYNDWVYSNKESVILKTETPDKIIYYTQSHLPWPIKDRDLVVELNIIETAGMLHVQAKSVAGYLPLNSNFIRVPYSLATWRVTQAADNKLKVDYTFSVDPGGSIPSWLVNATMAIGPYNSFLKLRTVLKKKAARQ